MAFLKVILRNYRWLSEDYEERMAVSEALCYWAMAHLMARRLTHGQTALGRAALTGGVDIIKRLLWEIMIT